MTMIADPVAERFGPYLLLERSGENRAYRTYRARDERTNDVVALRIAVAETTTDEGAETARRMDEEAAALAACGHPSIVTLHEAGRESGRAFLATSFVEGESLEARLATEPFPAREAAEIAYRLADATSECHSRAIYLSGLSPRTVYVGADGRPQLIRLLLTRDDERPDVPESLAPEIAAYCAPEELARGAPTSRMATDAYRSGGLLFALLTGRPPFATNATSDASRERAADEPRPPSRFAPRTPPELDAICAICLRKTPAARYPSAAALAEDLRLYLAGKPLVGGPQTGGAGMWGRGGRPSSRLVALLATTCLLAAAATFVDWRTWLAGDVPPRFPERPSDAGATSAVEPGGTPAVPRPKVLDEKMAEELRAWREYVAEARRIEPAWKAGNLTLAHERLAALAPESSEAPDLRGLEWRYWTARLRRDGRTYDELRGRSVALSPDGTRLAAADETHVQLVDPANGEILGRWPIGVADAPPTPDPSDYHAAADASVAFSRDGRRLAATSFRFDGERRLGSLKVWDLATGEERLKVTDDERIGGRAVVFSPDDEYVVAGGYGTGWSSWRLDSGILENPETKGPLWTRPVAAVPDDVRPATRGAAEWVVWDVSFAGRTLLPFAVTWPSPTGEQPSVRGLTLPGAERRGPNSPGAVAYGIDGRGEPFAAELTIDGTLRLHDIAPPLGTQRSRPLGEGRFTCVTAHEGRIAAAGADQIVRVWSVATPDSAPVELRGGEDLRGLRFRDDGRELVGWGRAVRTWKLDDAGSPLFDEDVPSTTTATSLLSPRGTYRARTQEQRVRVSVTQSDELVAQFPFDQLLGLRFSPGERYLAVSTVHGRRFSTSLWNLPERREAARLPAFGPYAGAVAFSRDERWIAANGSVWRTATGEATFVSGMPSDCAAFSDSGEYVAFADATRTQVYHVRTRLERLTIPRGAQALCFVEDDSRLVVAGVADIVVWDLNTDAEAPSQFEREAPTSMRETRDGRRLVLWQPQRFSVYAIPDYVRLLTVDGRLPARTNDVEQLLEELGDR